jgi:hypothetical protein
MEKFNLKLEERFRQVVSDKKKVTNDYKVLVELNTANETSLQELEIEFQILERFLLIDCFKMKLSETKLMRDAKGKITYEKLKTL